MPEKIAFEEIKILGDRVLILPSEGQDTTEGGIYIPPHMRPDQATGVVVKIGESVELNIMEGDFVFHTKGSGEQFEVDGVQYLMLREMTIQAYVRRIIGAKA